MPRSLPRNTLIDPYIDPGFVQAERRLTCGVCNTNCLCIFVGDLNLPTGIGVDSTILHNKRTDDPEVHVDLIGINCGCYAKFHRQVAHIADRMKNA